MGSTILQLCQDASDEPGMGMQRPDSLFPAADDGNDAPRKLLRALTRTVKDLAADYDWQALRREQVFTTTAQEVQPSAIPADFLRFVPDTFWNRTSKWKVNGPMSPAEWQEIKSWLTSSVTPYFTQRGNDVLFNTAPNAGLICAFEYITNAIGTAPTTVSFTGTTTLNSKTIAVANTTGLVAGQMIAGPYFPTGTLITAVVTNISVATNNAATGAVVGGSFTASTLRTRYALDTDLTFFDDELLVRGVVYEYRKGERFDYAQDQADFEKIKADRLKQDGGRKRAINMAGYGQSDAQSRIDAMRSAAIVIRT